MDNELTAQCLHTLRALPSSPDRAHTLLLELTARTIAQCDTARTRFIVLETARRPMARVQASLAARYASHPLPPSSKENQTFLKVLSLWHGMAEGYTRLLIDNFGEADLTLPPALLWQRRMHYSGRALLEHFRAHRMVPSDLWGRLLDSYAAAEQQGLANQHVTEPLSSVWQIQSPRECLITILLVDLANPFGRDTHEFEWICRWAERFAPFCDLRPTLTYQPDHATNPVMYALDLGAGHGLRPSGQLYDAPPGRVLHFDGNALATQIRTLLTQIKRGGAPSGLGLSRNAPIEPVVQLLLSLYRPWGLAAAGRRHRRRALTGQAELLHEWGTIATRISDDASMPHQAPMQLPQLGELWETIDQSIGGFRLNKRSPQQHLTHRQLVGVHPPDGMHCLLGMVSWLMYRQNGILEAGIALMAGAPNRVAVRCGNHSGHPRKKPAYELVFFIPAQQNMRQPASLVVPSGRYGLKQVLESLPGQAQLPRHLRLTGLLSRGSNFDQLAFEPINTPAA